MSGYDPQVEKLLAFSVEQYRELLQHAQKLSVILEERNPAQVSEYVSRQQQLQTAASRQDELLLPLLKADLTLWEQHRLYQMRYEFIRSILDLNKLLLPKIRGMMAVASAELGQLRGGRTFLAGYAPPTTDRRGLRGVG